MPANIQKTLRQNIFFVFFCRCRNKRNSFPLYTRTLDVFAFCVTFKMKDKRICLYAPKTTKKTLVKFNQPNFDAYTHKHCVFLLFLVCCTYNHRVHVYAIKRDFLALTTLPQSVHISILSTLK